MTLATVVGFSTFGDGITSVEINNNEYTNITDVHISDNGKIFVSGANGMTVAAASTLPADFLKSWNINVTSADAIVKQKTEEQQLGAQAQLDQAVASGAFREVDGMVYDIRRPESGWVTFYNAKVVQTLDDGTLVDLTPDSDSSYPVHVKNLGPAADTDAINFTVKLVGTYTYENKLGNDRTVRNYDDGTFCSRDEIPDSVLSGSKAFDVAIQSGAPTEDVLSKLPQSDDLQANGSGFFITGDGYLLTNFHVVKDAKLVKVKMGSDVYPAEIIKTDMDNDLALLKVSGQFKPLPISRDDAQLGEAVFTIGFPDIVLQGIQPKYTDGKISSLAGIKDDPKDYQISVPVQPGNSGGPLVDMSGNVVGIVEAKLDFSAALAASGDLPQNVNYAIKENIINDFLGQVPGLNLISTVSNAPGGVVSSTQQSVAMVLVY
jgi:S1-C subfamily serine protease